MFRRDLIGAWQRPQLALSVGLSHIRGGKGVDAVMIVLGADAHKRSHIIAAVQVASGEVSGDTTAAANAWVTSTSHTRGYYTLQRICGLAYRRDDPSAPDDAG